MARRTRRAAKKRLLKKILAPLLTLLAAALTGYSVWDYTGRREPARRGDARGGARLGAGHRRGTGQQPAAAHRGASVLIDAGEREASEASLRSSTRGGSPPLT